MGVPGRDYVWRISIDGKMSENKLGVPSVVNDIEV